MSENTEQLPVDVWSLSDEELSRLDISQYLDGAEPEPKEDPQPEPKPEPGTEPEPEPKPEPTGDDPKPEPEKKTEPTPATKPGSKDDKGADATDPNKPEPASQNVPDYKAFHDALTKPFKANGRDITISSPEEIIQLMQMGANYNAKMAALKPSRRLMKMLEQNQLMDEEKLGFLIDLNKRDPKAIAKLMQDSGFNVEEYDPEAQVDYKSTHVAPSTQQIDLEDVVQELQHQPGFKDVLTAVTTDWDPESQEIIGNNPQILRLLQQQKVSGHFDLIQAEVAKQALFGKANGMTTLQLYSAVESRLVQEGKLPGVKPAPVVTPTPEPAPVPTQAKEPTEDTTAKKKAAAAPKQTMQGKTTPSGDINIFSLTDEEFAKIDPSKFK